MNSSVFCAVDRPAAPALRVSFTALARGTLRVAEGACYCLAFLTHATMHAASNGRVGPFDPPAESPAGSLNDPAVA